MALSSEDVHGLVLIKDTVEANGTAVMGHLIKLAISSDPNLDVVLVSSHTSSSSYAMSLRRSGLPSTSLLSSGRIRVIEALRLVKESKGHSINLKSLSRLISEVLASTAAGRSLCIVFDDLSVLKCMASKQQDDWTPFLHYNIRNYYSKRTDLMNEPSPLQCTVIATVHCDIEDDRRWITALEHDASTVIEVSSIDGDFLRGRLLITRKNPPDLHKNMMEEYALGIRETLYSLNSWPLITQL